MIEFTTKEIKAGAHICPACGCRSFLSSAHIVQDWKINEYGDFVEILDDCVETTHFPNDEDIWDCENCGNSHDGRFFKVSFWAKQLTGIKTKEKAIPILTKAGYSSPEAENIAKAWLFHNCRMVLERACNCGVLNNDSNGNIAVYCEALDEEHPEGWYMVTPEAAVADLLNKPDAVDLLEKSICEKHKEETVFIYGDKHYRAVGSRIQGPYVIESKNNAATHNYCQCDFITAAESVGATGENVFHCLEDGKCYTAEQDALKEYVGPMIGKEKNESNSKS